LILASTGGAVVAALGAASLSLALGWGTPTTLAASVGVAGLASQLLLLPFFCDLRRSEPVAAVGERVALWSLVLVVPTGVFAADDLAAALFLVIPVLVWGGLRSGALEALAQLVVTTVLVAHLTTYGSGPFVDAAETAGFPTDTRGVLLAMFVAICAVVVLALVVSVGDQRQLTRQAATERDRVQNIVDGTLGVAIIGSDAAGRITLFNPGAERLLGYEAAEVLGRPMSGSPPRATCARPWRPSDARPIGSATSTPPRTPSSPTSATSCGRRSPASSATPSCWPTAPTGSCTPSRRRQYAASGPTARGCWRSSATCSAWRGCRRTGSVSPTAISTCATSSTAGWAW